MKDDPNKAIKLTQKKGKYESPKADSNRNSAADLMRIGHIGQKTGFARISSLNNPDMFYDSSPAGNGKIMNGGTSILNNFSQKITHQLANEVDKDILTDEEENEVSVTAKEVKQEDERKARLKSKFVPKSTSALPQPTAKIVKEVALNKYTPISASPVKLYRGEPSELHPLTCITILTNSYGIEWVDWLPETIAQTVRGDRLFIPEESSTYDMIQACQTLYQTEGFWHDWEVFMAMATTFTGEGGDLSALKPLSQGTMLFAKMVADDACDSRVEMVDEVYKYIASSIFAGGGLYAYGVLSPAQKYINKLTGNKVSNDDITYFNDTFDELYAQKLKYLEGIEPEDSNPATQTELVNILALVVYLKSKRQEYLSQL